jgi:hypothetical protein
MKKKMSNNDNNDKLNFIYTLGGQKVTLQEAAMIFYMVQKERELDKTLTFSIDDFVEYFNNTASRSSWLFAIDMMTLSDIVSKSSSGIVSITQYGESWIHNNFSSIYALGTVYGGSTFNETGKC